MSNLVNVPREHFEQLASAPLQLAQLEAQRMLAAGDTAGASRRIADGIQQAAAMRAQVAAQQPTAPAQPVAPFPPAAAPAPEMTPEQRTAAALEKNLAPFGPLARSLMPGPVRQRFIRQAEADAGIVHDPLRDPSLPYGLGPLPKPRI